MLTVGGNGELAGVHDGWNIPSVIKLDPALKADGTNRLALKVWTTAGRCGIYGPVGLLLVEPE